MFYCVLWHQLEKGEKWSEDETGRLFAKSGDAYEFASKIKKCGNVKDVHIMCARDWYEPSPEAERYVNVLKKEFENG